MYFNLSYMVFFLSLLLGTIISISSSSWIGAWMGLEINLLSFIPIMNKNNTPYENEAAMKYFLVQALASAVLLMAILMGTLSNFESTAYITYIIPSALLMKMGAAPFHFWFPGVMEGMEWTNCFILMTWQKIAPFALLSYKIYMNTFIMSVIVMSVMVGAIGGINQSSLRKIMAYSSISHIGWMMSAMMISNIFWMIYFMVYSMLNISVIYLFNSQSVFFLPQIYSLKPSDYTIKFSMFISVLSLGGLPPFLGFFPKWLIIQNMMGSSYTLLILIMVMSTLLTLYYYFRMMFSAFTFINQEMGWETFNKKNKMFLFFSMMSVSGIPLILLMPMN
uniref:NADH dehydrogenase subunit 2 n=1 Tax=Chlorogomphus shanicus TaxID=2077256 RepID=UPI0023AB50CD|nr:NADH dehydrogenase subunit 2 [Chlorogomphus shanicus]WCO11392.1 NADH dehydrogenase subunit 2 [Chlorogomphus shanicus]